MKRSPFSLVTMLMVLISMASGCAANPTTAPPILIAADFPIPLAKALRQGGTKLMWAGSCYKILAKEASHNLTLDIMDERLNLLGNRYEANQDWATGLWGGNVPLTDWRNVPTPGCDNDSLKMAIDEVELSIADFDKAKTPYAGLTSQGLWIGIVPLCADTVKTAKGSRDTYRDVPTVDVRLNDTSVISFADFTKKSIGDAIAIRFNGKIVASPYVREAITGGAIQISDIEENEVGPIVAATSAACPAMP